MPRASPSTLVRRWEGTQPPSTAGRPPRQSTTFGDTDATSKGAGPVLGSLQPLEAWKSPVGANSALTPQEPLASAVSLQQRDNLMSGCVVWFFFFTLITFIFEVPPTYVKDIPGPPFMRVRQSFLF